MTTSKPPKDFPPRVWIRTEPYHEEFLSKGEVVATDIANHYARRGSHWLEFVSLAEHDHLLAKSVAEAVQLVNETQNLIKCFTTNSSVSFAPIKEVWNMNARFLASHPGAQNEYLSRAARADAEVGEK